MQYALLVGGLANAVNELSVKLAQAKPNFGMIKAIVEDLSDCKIDGKNYNQTVVVVMADSNISAPSGIGLREQIRRFYNNNYLVYNNTHIIDYR